MIPATPFTVTVVAGPAGHTATLRLVGDLDLAAEPTLADTMGWLSVLAPRAIVIDLTSVAFVCSTFANFLAHLHKRLPEAALTVLHPSHQARVIIRVSGLDAFVTVSEPVPATPCPLDLRRVG